MKLRKCLFTIGIATLVFANVACGKVKSGSTTESNIAKSDKADEDFDVKTVAADIKNEGKFKDQLAEIDPNIAINRIYQLDSAKLEAYAFYTNTGATAEEIAVIKVNDDSYLKNIENAFNKRVDDQKEACRNYLPDEMTKLDKAVIKTSGSYIIFVVSEDSEKANEIIGRYFNQINKKREYEK